MSAADSNSNFGTTIVNITVLDENDNTPVFDAVSYTTNISETALPSTSLLTVQATDADDTTNAEIRYTIESGANSNHFSIVSLTGEVFVSQSLDRETRGQYDLVLGAVDQGIPKRTGFVALTIGIIDSNDNAPEFTTATFSGTVFENEVNYTVFIPGTNNEPLLITATDRDIGNNAAIEYTIVSGTDFRIKTSYQSGIGYVGVLETTRELDRETVDTYILTIRAVDGGGLSSATFSQVIIDVLDRDDNIPVFDQSEYTLYFYENGDVGESLVTVSATESDIGANNTQIKFQIFFVNEAVNFPTTGKYKFGINFLTLYVSSRKLSRSARRSFWSMILAKKLIRSAKNWNLLLYRNINL